MPELTTIRTVSQFGRADRNLVHLEPRPLLADEPTGNLDSASVDRVLAVFGQLHATGVTILLVTHDRSVAPAAERSLVMSDGRIERDVAEVTGVVTATVEVA